MRVEVHIVRMSYGACSARLCDLCTCSGMPCRRVGLHLGCKQPSREFCNSKLFVAGGTIIIITCAVAHPRETTSKANAGCHVCTLHDTYPAVRHHDTNCRSIGRAVRTRAAWSPIRPATLHRVALGYSGYLTGVAGKQGSEANLPLGPPALASILAPQSSTRHTHPATHTHAHHTVRSRPQYCCRAMQAVIRQ